MEWRQSEEEVAKLERLAELGSDSGWCRLCEALSRDAGAVTPS